MKDKPEATAAFREYRRLVIIKNDENWADQDVNVLESQIGRPIVGRVAFNAYAAVHAAYDEAITDVIAHALVLGVSQRELVDNRGWLSHNDIQGYIKRARRPHAGDYRPNWPQRAALAAVLADVAALRETQANAAASLLRSARSLLLRWAREIPQEPSSEQLAQVATMWRDEHVQLWSDARSKLIAEIDDQTRPAR